MGEEIKRKNFKLYHFQKNARRRNQKPFVQIPAFLKGMFREGESTHCSCVPKNPQGKYVWTTPVKLPGEIAEGKPHKESKWRGQGVDKSFQTQESASPVSPPQDLGRNTAMVQIGQITNEITWNTFLNDYCFHQTLSRESLPWWDIENRLLLVFLLWFDLDLV